MSFEIFMMRTNIMVFEIFRMRTMNSPLHKMEKIKIIMQYESQS